MYDDSAKGVAISPVTLSNHGVQLGVAPVSKEQFAESLIESAVEAGFAEMEGEKVIFLGSGGDLGIADPVHATDRVHALADTAYASGVAEHARVDVGGEGVRGGVDSGAVSSGTVPAGTVGASRDQMRQAPEEKPAVLHQTKGENDVEIETPILSLRRGSRWGKVEPKDEPKSASG